MNIGLASRDSGTGPEPNMTLRPDPGDALNLAPHCIRRRAHSFATPEVAPRRTSRRSSWKDDTRATIASAQSVERERRIGRTAVGDRLALDRQGERNGRCDDEFEFRVGAIPNPNARPSTSRSWSRS